MPIFELDDGHPVLVQPMQPTAGSFAPDSSALLAEHLTALLDEQLFPVRARHTDAPGPHLLALDAGGQPVVVDVVQVLDAESLVRALQHAGAASRLSRTELLRAYEGGADMFDTDFTAYRDGLPLSAGTPRVVSGARLLLVCSEVDPQVVDAITFLRQPGRQVEVLQMGIVRGADGRRYVDVSPLVLHQPARRAVEPASLRLVRSTDAFAEAMAYDAERAARSRIPYRELTPPTGEIILAGTRAAPTPVTGVPAARGAVAAEARRPERSTASGETTDDARTADASSVDRSSVDRDPSPRRQHRGHALASPLDAVSDPTTRSAAPMPAGATPAAGPGLPGAGAGPAVRPPTAPVARPASGPTGAPTASDVLPAPRALPPLAALVKGRGAVATLVWFRERRGQRLVATLRHDGLIELPSGRLHASPDDAAADAANAEGSVDGWHAWRLGDGGPTLAEATGQG